MKDNFWLKLKKPLLVLAPMAGITDSPFRQICKQFGADIVYSEMASVDALVYSPEKTLALLSFLSVEQPYIIQLFGAQPEHFAQAVRLLTNVSAIEKLGIKNYHLPAGFDINFGCPVPKVLKQGAGCNLFQDFVLARNVITSVIKNTNLPVSLKIRSQVKKFSALDFLQYVGDLDWQAVMIHGRSLAQGFSGDIDLEIIQSIKKKFADSKIILANGGIDSRKKAEEVLKITKADGLGLARGVLGRPWLFQEIKENKKIIKSTEEIIKIILEQAKLAEQYSKQTGLNFLEIRKHLAWYVSGFAHAKQLRAELMQINNFQEIKDILEHYS